MMALGPLAFAAPWALGALALLPALWWLLRVTPPAPRNVPFPAIRLLFGLDAREDAAARTPPWVLALRLALAAALILAVAHPLINPGTPMAAGGPLLVAVDDCWAAARDWPARRAWLDDLLARAERAGRPVRLLPTAPPADGGPVAVLGPLPASAARAVADALEPKPWACDRAAAAEMVKAIGGTSVIQAAWLADGLDDGSGRAFAQALQGLGGGVEMVGGQTGRVLLPPADDPDPGHVGFAVRRLAGTDEPETLAVRAVDAGGRVLGRQELALAPGKAEAQAALRLPTELRNKLVRLDIENERGAAAVVLLDDGWRRRPVGLAGGGSAAASTLLDRLYYLDKALAPVADLRRGEPADLLAGNPSVLILADVPAVQGATAERLAGWIGKGGVLVRFAGPALAHAAAEGGGDGFLPVRLLAGGRNLGGAMSWTAPMGLAPFPDPGPFAGLAVPADVKVAAQVLAEPSLELDGRTWARLADGTPLVTAERRDKGWVVLVHTSANAEWSNLPISGLFPAMLHRLVLLSEGSAGRPGGPLAPAAMLDGFGRLGPPEAAAAAIAGDPAQARPGPHHPPGLYGDGGGRVALNLGPFVERMEPLALPPGVSRSTLAGHSREIDLGGPLLAAAMLLGIVDLVVALALRGLLGRLAATALAALLLAPAAARAADDAFALRAGLQTRLAYVRTGDAQVDAKSRAGLVGLSVVLGQRSTAVLGEPMGLDLESDPLLFFPLLYWPVTAGAKPPSPAAAERLDAYMRHGGLIVFDTGDGAAQQTERLRAVAQGLAMPPLAPVTSDHVLTRAFYLLKEMPGRFDGAGVWAEDGETGDNDGVSPVVVGGNDWAGAWAIDQDGRPMFAAVPGGERQRELAYRFGINLVMYALTGNYKADQVHLPAILERLRR